MEPAALYRVGVDGRCRAQRRAVLVRAHREEPVLDRDRAGDLLEADAVPAERDGARERVVLEVEQVVGEAGVGATELGAPVVARMRLRLVRDQRRERSGGSE